MRPPPVLVSLLLVGCGPPCDPDLTCGAFQAGQAPFAANPAAVDGVYVPALADCTITETRTLETGTFDDRLLVDLYDDRGRRVLEEVHLDGALVSTTTSSWEGPCLAERVIRYADGGLEAWSVARCDDHGWPARSESWNELDGAREDEQVFRHDRSYDRKGRLIQTVLRAQGDDAGFEVQGTIAVQWRNRSLASVAYTDADGSVAHTTAFGWLPDGRLEREDVFLGPAHLTTALRWVYEDDVLVGVDDLLRGRVYTFERAPGARWPHQRVGEDGIEATLDYDCPGGP